MRVLVAISSAGVDPWLEIEESGQMRTFAASTGIENLEFVWVEGDPGAAKMFPFPIFNFIYRILHESLWKPLIRINTRKIPGVGELYWFLNSLLRPAKRLVAPKIYFLDVSEARNAKVSRLSRNILINRLALRILTRARSGGNRVDARRYRLDFPNSYFLAPIRHLMGFDFLMKEFEFDYLVRTTSTSYVNQEVLVRLLEGAPRSRFYGGEFMDTPGYRFACGGLTILSRDVVGKIVSLRNEFRLDLYDDVAVGKLIADYRLAEFYPAVSVDVRAAENNWERSFPHEWRTAPALRCKTETVTSDSESVIQVMNRVHSLLAK